jgi:DNA gyrase subunit A
VSDKEQLMVMTRNGVVNRQPVSEIRVIGRATQGVRLVNLDEGDLVMDVARVIIEENGEEALAAAQAAAEAVANPTPTAFTAEDEEGAEGAEDGGEEEEEELETQDE